MRHPVKFTYKEYSDEAKVKLTTLMHEEFVRRFTQHILPKRFVRIRHFRILSSTWKRSEPTELPLKLGLTPVPKGVKGLQINIYPCCQKGKMVTIVTFDSRGPPEEYMQLSNLVPPSIV